MPCRLHWASASKISRNAPASGSPAWVILLRDPGRAPRNSLSCTSTELSRRPRACFCEAVSASVNMREAPGSAIFRSWSFSSRSCRKPRRSLQTISDTPWKLRHASGWMVTGVSRPLSRQRRSGFAVFPVRAQPAQNRVPIRTALQKMRILLTPSSVTQVDEHASPSSHGRSR